MRDREVISRFSLFAAFQRLWRIRCEIPGDFYIAWHRPFLVFGQLKLQNLMLA